MRRLGHSFVVMFVAACWAYALEKSPGAWLTIPVLLVAAVLCVLNFKYLYGLVSSVHFAAVNALIILFVTVVGTFLRDGGWIYRSWWFNSFLLLLGVGLVAVTIKRKQFRIPTLGFFLAHLGTVLVLLGALAGTLWGVKGFIQMREGRTADAYVAPAPEGEEGHAFRPLGFELRLNKFTVDKYPPERRLYIYEQTGEGWRPIHSTGIEEARTEQRIPGVDGWFRVVEYFPNLVGEARLIHGSDEPRSPMLAGRLRGRPAVLRAKEDANNTIHLPDKSLVVRFSWDPPERALLDQTVSGGFKKGLWFVGADREVFHLQQDTEPQREPLEKGRTYGEFLVTDFGPDARVEFVRRSEGDEPLNPVVDLEYRVGGEEGRKLLPFGTHSPLSLPGGRFLILFRMKPESVQAFRSDISVLEEGREVDRQIVEVNSPLYHRGFYFYQSDYDKRVPDYSGIQVVRDPGLWAVILGMVLMCLGVPYILYVQPRLRKS